MISFAVPLLAVFVIFSARMLELAKRRDVTPGSVRERWSLRLIWIAGIAIPVTAVWEYVRRDGTADWPWLMAGIVGAVVSFSLRQRAIAALGRFWSMHVEIRTDHRFVNDGPFRWMRHPTYSSMLLELLSIAIILKAPIAGLLIAFIYLPVLYLRLRIEEPALIEKFGDTYREYMRTTPAVLPIKFIRH